MILAVLLTAAGTYGLATLARFSQTLRPPLPASSLIVRVPITIATVPANATVSVDQHELGITPLNSSLPVGVHEIELISDGYAPLKRHIELVPGSPLEVSLPLEPLPQVVRVVSDAEEVQVSIDGKLLSGSDREFVDEDLGPGIHTLAISGKQARASLKFRMKPAAAPVVTEPPEARDFTIAAISRFGDDAAVVASGTAKIGLTHGPIVEAGPAPIPLPVADDQHAQLLETGLRRTTPLNHAATPSLDVLAAIEGGSLVVNTGADDAVVWINGTMSRRHPEQGRLFFSGLPAGDYEIRAARPDGPEKSAKVTIVKDQQTLVSLPVGTSTAIPAAPQASRIRPAQSMPETGPMGLARFVVKTPGARITIRRADRPDPLIRLVVTDSLRLPAGRWVLHATAPGFKSYTTEFLVNQAGPADVLIKLEPSE